MRGPPTEWVHEAAARILCAVMENGPRKRTVLVGLGGTAAGAEAFKTLLDHGVLVVIGSKRGAKYGTPLQAKAHR